jgi:hypothetical protein
VCLVITLHVLLGLTLTVQALPEPIEIQVDHLEVDELPDPTYDLQNDLRSGATALASTRCQR